MSTKPRFDLNAVSATEDPYPAYETLRLQGPVARTRHGHVVLSRYRDVSRFLHSRDLCNSFPDEYRRFAAGQGPSADFLGRILLHRDSQHHRDLRRVFAGALLGKGIAALAIRAHDIANRLLAAAVEQGSVDAVADLALALPFQMICALLGIPSHDLPRIAPHAKAISGVFRLQVEKAERDAADSAITYLREYMAKLIRTQGTNGDEFGTLTAVKRYVEAGGAFDDILDNVVFLFFAGFETTAATIGTSFAVLSQNPSLYSRLALQPSLIPGFIEEILRYDAPIQSRARIAIRPLSLDRVDILPGRLVILLIGAANRDPDAFERPDEIDPSRAPNSHLSFGLGPHSCLGAQLARIEVEALLSGLCERCTTLLPVTPAKRDMGSVFRSYETVQVRLR